MATRHQRRHEHRQATRRDDADASGIHSPEAMRQMGAAISVAAARTGLTINPGDPALHDAIARYIGRDGLARLAAGDAAVIGAVGQFVEKHAATIAQFQKEHDPRNFAQAGGTAPGAGEALTERLQRLGAYGPPEANGLAEPSSGSSARFAKDGMASDTFDLSKVSAAKFYTDPSFGMFRAAGMGLEQTQQLYRDLNRQGFSNREVYRAANDVGDLRIGASPDAMKRNAGNIAHLNKSSPKFMPRFKEIDKSHGDAWVEAEGKARHLQRQLDEARKKGDKAVADKLEKQAAEARKQADAIREQTMKHENEAIAKHVKPADKPRAEETQKETWKRRKEDVKQLEKKLGAEALRTATKASEGQEQKADAQVVADARVAGTTARQADRNFTGESAAADFLSTNPETKAAAAQVPGSVPSSVAQASPAQPPAATEPAAAPTARPAVRQASAPVTKKPAATLDA